MAVAHLRRDGGDEAFWSPRHGGKAPCGGSDDRVASSPPGIAALGGALVPIEATPRASWIGDYGKPRDGWYRLGSSPFRWSARFREPVQGANPERGYPGRKLRSGFTPGHDVDRAAMIALCGAGASANPERNLRKDAALRGAYAQAIRAGKKWRTVRSAIRIARFPGMLREREQHQADSAHRHHAHAEGAQRNAGEQAPRQRPALFDPEAESLGLDALLALSHTRASGAPEGKILCSERCEADPSQLARHISVPWNASGCPPAPIAAVQKRRSGSEAGEEVEGPLLQLKS